MKRQDILNEVISILRREYPNTHTALYHKNPFQLLVATILSAQCTDERVNKVTPALFEKYVTASDFAGIEQLTLEHLIHSTGFFRNKAKNIIAMSKKVVNNFSGEIPDVMEKLITLPGVARKTANIILSSCFGKAEGIAVDTHVKRLSVRIGFSKEKNSDKIEKDLMKVVPRKDWLDISYILIDHGRKICVARKPLCLQCPIKNLCPSKVEFYPEKDLL